MNRRREEELLIISCILAEEEEEEERRKRRKRWWVHAINRKRESLGEFHHLFPDLVDDGVKFFRYFRMSQAKFNILLNILGPHLAKQDYKFRRPIDPQHRLALFLRAGGSTNGTELAPLLEDGERQAGCRCWVEPSVPECECKGDGLVTVPANITVRIERLTIENSGIQILKNDSLFPYRETLKDLTLLNNQKLEELEPGLFEHLDKLTTVYIVHAPLLKTLHEDLFKVNLPHLKILRIMHSGLTSLPQISQLKTYHNVMTMLDLESNMIQKLTFRQINISAESLLLSDNQIEEIEGYAFQGSKIHKLTLRGNKALRTLDENAFFGIAYLRDLDLSETSISHLPTTGLHELEILRLQNVRTLKVFPSIYNFPHINRVSLTYAYHCCAFTYPSRHDPARYAQQQDFEMRMAVNCRKADRMKRSWGPPISSGTTGQANDNSEGTFHQEAFHNVSQMSGPRVAECGILSKDYRRVVCEPAPDAFNPCEDLMGNWTLRVAVWIVAIAALLGNTAVLLVLLSSRFRMTVPKFLMCNLALADLCMGIYLLMIAAMDAKSIGDYFNYAIDWQSGYGCQIAGFLTVFSSELSILTLMVITSERWYTITYAIHMNKRLKLSTAVKIMGAGWVYATLMAALPLMGVSGYYKTSICLPLEVSTSTDIAYLTTLLTFNGIAFWVICLCYGRMYCSIRQGRDAGGRDAGAALNNSDMTVAKRMALLVFTDFACWAPIAFFGLTALAGYPLIDVTNTKILLVFFYPLNSCANPYLYALLTHQYRRDVLILLSRYGICSERAARQKAGGGGPGAGGWGPGAGGGGPGAGGGARQRPAGRGSLLTTLNSLAYTLSPSHKCSAAHRYGICSERAARQKAGGGGPGAGGGARQRPAGRGSLLTTLTSLDCARQHSLGPLPEMTLSIPNNGTTPL